jgi:hypothetical protein
MFERIIRFAIEQRWLVMLAVAAMAALGVFSYQRLPIDAVPDITNVQVQINTPRPAIRRWRPSSASPIRSRPSWPACRAGADPRCRATACRRSP